MDSSAEARAPPRITVLIVDDEEPVRDALRRTLRRSGYDLRFADGAPAALALLEREPVDVVVSDQHMLGMSGLELLQAVRRIRPHTARVMLTAHADLGTAMTAIRDGDIDRFLLKPWDGAELRAALQQQAEKAAARGAPAPAAAARPDPELLQSPGVTAARVLVVEDSRTQAEWLAEILAREGYEVQVAPDGREAVRRVRTEPPDLVLLDVILPDMDGLEVLRILKARADEQFIPVILLSVKGDLDSRVAGLRIGADDFLAKPFAEAEIQARAAAMLRIKSLQDQLRATKAELEKLSVTDGLTGLYNRRHFEDRLREEFRRCQRYSDPVSLLMLDLDHFKDVNDRYGHPFGDRVLRETGELLESSVREPDICARYGGEEFAIILPKTHLQGALTVAERIFKSLRLKTYPIEPALAGGGAPAAIRITASAGLAFFPSKDVTAPEGLVKFADEALYRAKREGRDTICLYQAQSYRYDAGVR